MKSALLSITFFLLSSFVIASDVPVNFDAKPEAETAYSSFVFELDHESLASQLALAPREGSGAARSAQQVVLPMPDGSTQKLDVVYAPIIADGLAERYPEIRSYKVQGEGISGRIGFTYKGFHGMLFTEKGTVYIDRINEDADDYNAYYRNDFMEHHRSGKGHHCALDDEVSVELMENISRRGGDRSGEVLRTYRLALACTGEYTQFHGGSVSGALSAMVVTMNRVNGIYEREVSLTMEIIANNDDLIFTNPNSDPYTNNSGGAMLGQNQSTINGIIGSSGYDIGHVFSTGGGGIAALGSVCSSNSKARGVTGSFSPVGDPFDVDFVAHEIGHQFGGEHTFNGTSGSCGGGNREGTAAFEPGSGSTIMAYAGICNAHNIQNNSDDYFHAYSLDQIIQFSQFSNGNNCAATSNTGNNPPVVDAGTGGFHIPSETPFVLTGSATDPNGDDLTYAWEQMDLGPGGSPDSPFGDAPIFRSWDPVTIPERTFPRAVNVVIGNTVFGETYPTYSRNMTFRLTARDQNTAGGGVGFDEISFDVDGGSGPFEVTSPAASEQVQAGNGYVITWDVAGTDMAPVNCQNVIIELCTFSSGAFNVIETLATNTPNDGSETVNISTASIGTGRYVRVRAADNVFFNINEGQFVVVEPEAPEDFGISLTATPDQTNMLVELNWTDSFNNETYFMIERSLGNNFTFSLIDSVGANVTTYDDLTADMYGMNYYRVRAKNAGGYSQYSNEATYQGLGLDEVSASNVRVYPNPTSDRLSIEFNEPIETEEAQIIGENGKVVRVIRLNTAQGTQDISLEGLSAGQYWIRMTSSGAEKNLIPFQIIR